MRVVTTLDNGAEHIRTVDDAQQGCCRARDIVKNGLVEGQDDFWIFYPPHRIERVVVKP